MLDDSVTLFITIKKVSTKILPKMSARIHSRNVQESHQKFYHKSPREFTYFLYKSSPFMTMRILPPYAQWSTLVLERHILILANLFKSEFDGLKISIEI